MLMCCVIFGGCRGGSGSYFSLRRRGAFSLEVRPVTLFFFVARKKAHKRIMQYLPRENVFFSRCALAPPPPERRKNIRTDVIKTVEIQAVRLRFFLFFGSAPLSFPSCPPESHRRQKNTPKWNQNRPQNGPKRPPDGHKLRSKPVLDFRLNFGSILNDFWSQNGCQNEPQKLPKTSFGAQGPPRGLQGAIWLPRGLQGGFLVEFSAFSLIWPSHL